MNEKKFDPEKLRKLNNPERLKDIPPDYVWEKLNILKTDVMVEIGAGTAFFSIAFFNLANPSKLYACDVSNVMLDWVKENVVQKYPEIIPVKTEEDSVPLDDATADLVFMINLHHELDNPGRSVEEAYRLLKPGGTVFIVDWKKEAMADGPPERIRWQPDRIMEQLADSGFQNVRLFTELTKHYLLVGEKNQ